jgi:putative membrane protein
MLKPQAQREIEAAFDAALAKTRAPLQCVMAQTSADYALFPVLAAALVALAAPWPLLWLTPLAPERVYLIQLALFALLAALIAWTPVRVALASQAHRRSAGHRAALTQFALRGLDHAPERNGVLLYVSVSEHYARIVADVGFDDKISSQEWRGVIDDLCTAMRGGPRETALKSAALSLSDLLARHFPAVEGDVKRKGECFHIVR